jgi:uncharacterized protein (TIGR04222 family)
MKDTWGIPGPLFVFVYLAAEVVVGVWSVNVRCKIKDTGSGADRQLDPESRHDALLAAYLAGGQPLALLAALGGLRAAGELARVGNSVVARGGRRIGGLSELERAVLGELAEPTYRPRLDRRPKVYAALEGVRAELVGRGLLLDRARRARFRWTCLPWLGLVGVGIARFRDGVRSGHPVGLLAVLLIAAILATGLAASRPTHSEAGNIEPARLREQLEHLHPEMNPSWTTLGGAAAAFGIALYGTSALWAAEPEFARALGAARNSYAAPSGGGGSGCGGGGGGGCGGGGCGGGCGG